MRAAALHHPTSIDEVRRIVAGSEQVRTLGSGHSFNPIADTVGDQISLARMPPSVHIDAERSTVTVGGGVRYGELAQQLHRAGYALHNLGSLPHICIAGATATGTHGSGVANGNLATAVRALEIVTGSGDVVTLEMGDDDFPGAVVGLGMLGVATSVTLAIEPTFAVAQYVYDDLPLAKLTAHLDETMEAAYSVSAFTDWRGPVMTQVWMKHRIDAIDAVAELEPRCTVARRARSQRPPASGAWRRSRRLHRAGRHPRAVARAAAALSARVHAE